jgi:hypothetical protein
VKRGSPLQELSPANRRVENFSDAVLAIVVTIIVLGPRRLQGGDDAADGGTRRPGHEVRAIFAGETDRDDDQARAFRLRLIHAEAMGKTACR